jgi:hypothetical protein
MVPMRCGFMVEGSIGEENGIECSASVRSIRQSETAPNEAPMKAEPANGSRSMRDV